ncbi:uncharacterized protein BJ171DRAFT_598806, partial [Polychytrium aggregatum]|uniref:uncharacterized protein n=1 Tax=Polychytrium aggregatum TaxID=110093 RepID=UPI0022FE3EE5
MKARRGAGIQDRSTKAHGPSGPCGVRGGQEPRPSLAQLWAVQLCPRVSHRQRVHRVSVVAHSTQSNSTHPGPGSSPVALWARGALPLPPPLLRCAVASVSVSAFRAWRLPMNRLSAHRPFWLRLRSCCNQPTSIGRPASATASLHHRSGCTQLWTCIQVHRDCRFSSRIHAALHCADQRPLSTPLPSLGYRPSGCLPFSRHHRALDAMSSSTPQSHSHNASVCHFCNHRPSLCTEIPNRLTSESADLSQVPLERPLLRRGPIPQRTTSRTIFTPPVLPPRKSSMGYLLDLDFDGLPQPPTSGGLPITACSLDRPIQNRHYEVPVKMIYTVTDIQGREVVVEKYSQIPPGADHPKIHRGVCKMNLDESKNSSALHSFPMASCIKKASFANIAEASHASEHDATSDHDESKVTPPRKFGGPRRSSLSRDAKGFSSRSSDGASSTGETTEASELLTQRRLTETVRDVMFALLFYIVHGNTSSVLDYVSLVIEDGQLLCFFFSDSLRSVYMLPDFLVNFVEVKYLTFDITPTYVTLNAIAVSSVALLILNIIYICWGLFNGKQEAIWPIKTLRFFASYLPTVFYIPIVESLMSALVCTIQSSLSSSQLGGSNCVVGSRLPLFVVSIITLVVYIPIAAGLSVFYLNPDPTLKSPMSKVHGRVDLAYIFLKSLLVLVWLMVPANIPLLRIGVATMVPGTMLMVLNYYLPYYNPRINQMRSGFYFSAFGIGLIAFITCLVNTFGGSNLQTSSVVPIVMGSLIAPLWVTGYFFTAWLLKWIESSSRKRLADALSTVNPDDDPIVFYHWTHVEITARFITAKMDSRRRNVKQALVGELRDIFLRGITEFPRCHWIRLCYASYFSFVQQSKMEAAKQLRQAQRHNSPIDVRFQIYWHSSFF